MKAEQRKWLPGRGWEPIIQNHLQESAQVVFLFGDYALLQAGTCLRELRKTYPRARIVGCSTAGEIMKTSVLDKSAIATAVALEASGVQVVTTSLQDGDDGFVAGHSLADALPKEGLVHVFTLADGLRINGSRLVKGLTEKLPAGVAVTGGLAGDQGSFKETLVCCDEKCASGFVAAVGFYGERLKVGYGSMGGWDSFGPDRLVTRSRGNVLYELDGVPALQLYKKYLGEQAQGLPATGLLFPLSVRAKDGKASLVRTILAVNENDGSMTFAGDVPQGSYARLMKANFERLIDGAAQAASMSNPLSGSRPVLAVLISCVGRKLVLKQRVEEEVESVQEALGGVTAMTGFYSYGEICPVAAIANSCELHNQTMTITTFQETGF